MLLAEFDITYVTQKSVKGQAIADHLAHLPLPQYEPVRTDFPDESILFAGIEEAKDDDLWTMYFEPKWKRSRGGAIIPRRSCHPEGLQDRIFGNQ